MGCRHLSGLTCIITCRNRTETVEGNGTLGLLRALMVRLRRDSAILILCPTISLNKFGICATEGLLQTADNERFCVGTSVNSMV